MSDPENKQDGVDVKVHFTKEARRGEYSNFVRIQHTAMDFRMDFAKAIADEQTLIVHSRIFMSPVHAKMFLRALDDNIRKYEAQFGAIELTPSAGAIPVPGTSSHSTH
jgi:hypothetical protein